MKIKTKLRFGFGFLFIVILSFGGISLFYLDEISGSARVILKDNYETLHFTRAMRAVLDEQDQPFAGSAAAEFGRQLELEEKNITERGEANAVTELRKSFGLAQLPGRNLQQQQEALRSIHRQLRMIEEINMDAIVRKNKAAQQSVKRATIYLGLSAAVSFMILFSFIVNFPGFVANPLRELSDGIREISRGNYRRRLEFNGNDEFAGLATAFNQMAIRLDEWENSSLATIKSEKLRIEAIISQMHDAIIGLNERDEILFINPVAAELLNVQEQQVTGKNAAELATRNDLLTTILKGQSSEKPLKIFANGKESYFQLEASEIIVPEAGSRQESAVLRNGKPAGKVYILRNITQFKELDEAKTNFIATVSHELKTPLASIKMSLKLLADGRIGELNDEQTGLVNHIRDDAGRLLKITSELLDLAAVETGNIQLNLASSHPSVILDYALNAVRLQAEDKQIALERMVDEPLSNVVADVEKTAWVLINFLSNALRYGPEKSKVIIRVAGKAGRITFSVRDFGKGIDDQYKQRLFERYFQVPTDGTNKSGSGLGLAISKEFIEAENGKIWVESALGEGSMFCFSLPTAFS